MSIGPQAPRNAGNVPMYDCGVPPPPKLAASARIARFVEQARRRVTALSFAATRSSASSQEIGTKPGSSSRPFFGLVRFIGVRTRFGL